MNEPREMYAALKSLQIGDRAWYWLCLDVPAGAPPLLLSRLADDPGMQGLEAMVAAVPRPVGAQSWAGVATVTADGSIELGGADAGANGLARLARWARQGVAEKPVLARLKDLSLVQIADGVVVGRTADAGLWADLPDAPPPAGSLEATARQLLKLPPGRDAWFWLCSEGPDGEAALLLGNPGKDPQGTELAGRAARERLRGAAGAEVRGLARTNAEGALTLILEDDLEPAADVLEELAGEYPALAGLGRARLVQMEGGHLSRVLLLPRPPEPADAAADAEAEEGGAADLSAQSAALEALAAGGEAMWFWFTRAGADGQPMLVLAADRDALRDLARQVGGGGESLRGQVGRSEKGWLHFQAREASPGFLQALAGWAGAHHARWPGLRRLQGARLTCADRDGQILLREREDDAWAAALAG